MNISTHALREEGDLTARSTKSCCVNYFYPRPPRGGRPMARSFFFPSKYFYPRPPRGGRLLPIVQTAGKTANFYPRPPRGGRRGSTTSTSAKGNFYPRPPRGGRLRFSPTRVQPAQYFYPRPPRGGRHKRIDAEYQKKKISTHALREEGDSVYAQYLWAIGISTHALREEGDRGGRRRFYPVGYFYPRPPRGGRRLNFSRAIR